jgi:hypothetical protein
MYMDELIALTKKEKRWLIENLIPMGEIVILYAPQNQYKTFLSLKIALEVITGSKELGASENGKVLFHSTDTAVSDFLIRLTGLLQERYTNLDIGENLDIEFENHLDLTNEHYESNIDYYAETGEQIHWSWKEQGDWNARDGVKLIIIDTLSQSIGANSINDDSAIRSSIKNLKKWIQGGKGKFSILVIAHASYKNPSKGIMGSSILKNDFPTVLKIKKGKNNQMLLYREKMKCDAEGTSIPFNPTQVIVDEVKTRVIDIGTEMSKLELDIIDLCKQGLSKDEIRYNTYEMYKQQYNTMNSYGVVFNRRWKALLNQGFLKGYNTTTIEG